MKINSGTEPPLIVGLNDCASVQSALTATPAEKDAGLIRNLLSDYNHNQNTL